jgi:hypothetical protein
MHSCTTCGRCSRTATSRCDATGTSGKAWALRAQGGASAYASRAFPALQVGEQVSVELDADPLSGIAFAGVELLSSGSIRFDFRSDASVAHYLYQDGASFVTSSAPVTQEGVRVDMLLADADHLSLRIDPLQGSSQKVTTALLGSGAIDSLRLFIQGDNDASPRVLYANRLSVPEPAAAAAGAAALLAIGAARALAARSALR